MTIAVAGVVGAGTMGRGIARWLAEAGVAVRVHDAAPGSAAAARAAIAHDLDAAATRGKVTRGDADATIARLTVAEGLAALAGADLVIEAIVEALDAKRALLAALEPIVGDACVLATNTSSLGVGAIAAACVRPARVIGLHFFNPVHAMRVVEVIPGARTDATVVARCRALVERTGHAAVTVRDTPGFLVNHAGRGYGTEALRLLHESVAPPHVVDALLRGQAGFRLGPFELFDLVGLDVSVPVMEGLYRAHLDEPRFRPTPLLAARRDAGLLGRKSGEGFYAYVDGRAVVPLMPVPPMPEAMPPVWVSDAEPDLGRAVRALCTRLGATVETGAHPSTAAIAIVTPLGDDATTCVIAERLDPARTVAVDALFDLSTARTLMATPATDPAVLAAIHALLASDGATVGVVGDSAGLVCQRVVAMVVSVGCGVVEQGVATAADVDRAVVLGLGYPQGPLAWGDALGAGRVARILERMHALTGEARYRVPGWLRRRVGLGMRLSA